MAIPHFVKKARKDNPVVKKGESYYWWAFMIGSRGGPKHYSKNMPRPSQLTGSPYLSQAYAILESLPDDVTDMDDWEALQSDLTGLIEELGSECQDSLDNMPEHLQEADTGCLLQERIDACNNASMELENIDYNEICNYGKDDFDMSEVEQILEELDV